MSPKTWKPAFILPGKEAFQQAWNLFVFSAIFAVLFNTFFSDGIEIKVKPAHSFRPPEKSVPDAAPVTGYPGWKTASIPPKPAASPSPFGDITRLSLMGAKSRFDKKSCTFLDARNPEEYKQGHIPGSLNFPALDMDKFAPLILPQLTDKGKEIVAYCNGGDCTLSLELARTLLQQGYTHVEVFEGGWPEWKKASYPDQAGGNP